MDGALKASDSPPNRVFSLLFFITVDWTAALEQKHPNKTNGSGIPEKKYHPPKGYLKTRSRNMNPPIKAPMFLGFQKQLS